MSSRLTQIALVIAASALLTTGCSLFGSKDASSASNTGERLDVAGPSLGVNSFLWRASLETLDFMPLDNVDPFGGVIVTEWYANPSVPGERFKATVYILDTQLRADALKVSIFKQTQSGAGWNDAAIDADTARQIENAILTRAREIFIATN